MPPTFWEKFVELNREMLRANSTLKKEHRWASHWWEWPLMLKTILYWRANGPPYVTAERPHARIYCIGTPAVWWLAALGPSLFVAWAVAAPILYRGYAALPWGAISTGAFLVAGYLVKYARLRPRTPRPSGPAPHASLGPTVSAQLAALHHRGARRLPLPLPAITPARAPPLWSPP